MIGSHFIRKALLAFAVWALSGMGAFAACTSPAGVESQMQYDFTAHILKYCDGTNWIAAGGQWEQVGSSVATTSGSSWSFTDIPAYYTDLMLVFNNFSTSSNANILFRTSTSSGGSPTWGTHHWVATSSAAAASVTIFTNQFAANASNGVVYLGGNTNGVPVKSGYWILPAVSQSGYGGIYQAVTSSPILAVGVTISAGTGDAGSLSLWGLR